MKTNVLVPTDFSENAWVAVEYALRLYKNESCNFYILNVFNLIDPLLPNLLNMDVGSELYEQAKEESEEELAKIINKIVLKNGNSQRHNFTTLSVFNNTVEAIKNTVEEKDIEMIVMGTKGKTNARKSILGSKASYVIEKVRNCPVIVVPEYGKHQLPKEIVFPTDYKTQLKKRELKSLIHIAKSSLANIAILHVMESDTLDENQNRHKRLLEEIFEEVSCTHYTLPEHFMKKASYRDLENIINLFVFSRNSDMIAFISKKHSMLGAATLKPFLKRVIAHAGVPILVMHEV
ncbi:MAG TPA: universal stress protein [Flavobacteriaceae bacterium]|nr:universal stress protein [Flavobacteriaceae bacterium]